MYVKPYIELARNFISLLDFNKSINLANVEKLQNISFKDEILVTNNTWNSYKKLVQWDKNFISPIFPYALLTHLHIKLASHKLFPSHALGILHKKETIQQFKAIKLGKWIFKCSLKHFLKVDSGYEASIVTNLYIEDDLVWQSETIGLVKEKKKLKKKKIEINKNDVNSFEKVASIEVSPYLANRYAWFSGNIDPIHFSVPTAKLMGHPSSIMHGMWSVGRIVSAIQTDNFNNTAIKVKFISGLYLPGKANILCRKDGNKQVVQLENPKHNKPYLICEVSSIAD